MSRVLVVGAGVGGLAAAVRLAAAGHTVTVLEQSAVVGGKLGVLAEDEFVFDTGPSLVTMPHLYRELFAATGAPLDEVLELERLDIACRYRFTDGTVLDLPGARTAIAPALDAALGHGAGAQWEDLLTRAERVWHATHEGFLESPISALDLVRLSTRVSDLAAVAPWSTLRRWGARSLHDPRLRMLLDRYATYTGSDPRRAPAALATVPYVEQEWGSWYVRGGLRRIADALVDRARALGVELWTSTRVQTLATGPDGVRGVRLTDGVRLPADVVVVNADAATVYGGLLAPGAGRAAGRRLRRATPSSSGFVLLLGLDGRDPDTPHHRVLFPDDYDAEFDAVFGADGRRPRPVDAPTVYVSAPDDPAVRPDADSESWFVLVNAPRHDPAHGVDWDAPGLADEYADRVLAVMADRGVEVRGRVRRRWVRTPADLERRTLSPGGSIYGSSSNGARAAFLRPANRTAVPGLFLVGGSSHPGGGLPLVALSSRIVADLVGPAT